MVKIIHNESNFLDIPIEGLEKVVDYIRAIYFPELANEDIVIDFTYTNHLEALAKKYSILDRVIKGLFCISDYEALMAHGHVFYHAPKNHKKILLSYLNITTFKSFIETLLHEMIHFKQLVKGTISYQTIRDYAAKHGDEAKDFDNRPWEIEAELFSSTNADLCCDVVFARFVSPSLTRVPCDASRAGQNLYSEARRDA